MYKVYCDGLPIYNYKTDRHKIFEPSLELELNKTGSFSFVIRPDHVNFDIIRKMKSIIEVYQNDYLLFRGRVLNTEEGFYNEKQVVCEGELAFLLDSEIEPEGTEENPVITTPRQYLTSLIERHNARMGEGETASEWKKFSVGEVDLGEDEDGNLIADKEIGVYSTDYKKTFDLINENLIDVLGGYLWVTGDEETRVINYYSDFNYLSNQTIELSKNLLDLHKISKGEEVATAIIPVGGESDSKTTIVNLIDGEVGQTEFEGESATIYKKGDYLYCDKAVEKYGWIFRSAKFDGVNDAEELKKVAIKELVDKVNMSSTIELTAADLSGIKEGVNPFRLGVKIKAISKVHNLEAIEPTTGFLVKKLAIDILNPANNKLTINDTFLSYTQEVERKLSGQAGIVERVDKISRDLTGAVTDSQLNNAVEQVIEQNSSELAQTSTEIMSQVSQEYYTKEDASALVQSIETQFSQTNEEFEFRFNEFQQDIDEVASGADARFTEISKYIRFVDGNIILGETGNELTLNIQNDRISFLQSGAEVAYFSNRKLYVTDAEFLNSLTLGNFAFIPRANGNLSFKKVK